MPTASTVPDAPSIASRTSRDRADDGVEHAGLVDPARRARRAMVDVQSRVDRAGQELRATEVDPDHAAGRHDRPPYRAHAAPTDPEGPPEYRVYRSRKAWLPRRGGDDRDELAQLRGERRPQRAKAPRKGVSTGRVVRWVLTAVLAWVLLASLVFLVSAQIQQGSIGDEANERLGGAGYPAWSPNNVLVLGSDQRTADTREPGASTTSGRADSIMLMRVGGGANSRLSIARDTVVDIPGHGRGKINSAFAYGGTALAIETVEQYTGVDVNHVVVVSFEDFPQLIDAMGGITYRGGCVVSRINGGFRNGGYTLRLRAGQDAHRRQAGAGARAHAQERVQQARGRPHPRAPPAEGHQRDEAPAAVAVRVRAPAADRLGRAEVAALGHERADAARAVRRARRCPAAPRPRCSAPSRARCPTTSGGRRSRASSQG